MKLTREEPKAWSDDVALCGPDAPKNDGHIKHMIEYLLTVYRRFGNTTITADLQWGATAMWKRDEKQERIVELEAQLALAGLRGEKESNLSRVLREARASDTYKQEAAALEAAGSAQEPIAWRWRGRARAIDPWCEWDAGPVHPPYAASENYQIEPLYRDPAPHADALVLYEKLIYAVGKRCPGETRHQTALRYIQQAEAQKNTAGAAMGPDARNAERYRWLRAVCHRFSGVSSVADKAICDNHKDWARLSWERFYDEWGKELDDAIDSAMAAGKP